MSAADDFRQQFDASGRFRKGNGELPVVIAMIGGGRFPGKLRFKDGLCIHAEMEGIGDWGLPDESPLHGISFLLDFGSPELDGVIVYHGHVVPIDKTASPFVKRDFLANFRIARNLFLHPQVSADSPAIDTATVERTLARAAIWLTPKSVACFNAADFPELGPAGQQELLSAVQHFVTVASGVPADQPPTNEQYRNAAAAFQKILTILDPYLPLPDEARNVENALRTVAFPAWVVNWDYELRSNSDGMAVVWVNVFADEQQVPANRLGREVGDLTSKVLQAFGDCKIDRWPRIRLREAMEHKAG